MKIYLYDLGFAFVYIFIYFLVLGRDICYTYSVVISNIMSFRSIQEAISNPLTVAELLNPAATRHSHSSQEYNLGPLHVFREHFLVSHNEHFLYILDPRSLQAVAVLDQLRKYSRSFIHSFNETISKSLLISKSCSNAYKILVCFLI